MTKLLKKKKLKLVRIQGGWGARPSGASPLPTRTDAHA